ncbi:hypothetical protein AX14_006209 [Amanita brunnescens Koide BX004]|nr:hypothetical protein AX14_006209 [Amanita brunnescens Koide BX004]
MSPVLSSPHFNDRFGSVDDAPSKSLTPQRKHRKLLKDGSGIEVWPESVEKIFVEGLRKYWESPYATSSQSRGRSRWRNQFLVDYLKSAGVERSKKQVASHIQVLRNMWKGEPEFHLVAGGDELFSELSHSNVKQEEQGDSLAFGYDDGDDSSNGTPPFSSPSDVKTEFPPSPGIPLCTFPPDVQTYYAPMSNGISMSSSMLPTASSNAQRSYSMNMGTTEFSTSATPYDFSAPPNFVSHGQFSPETMPSQAMSHRHTGKAARVKALRLAAEGIAPLWVRLDALISLGQLAPHTPLSLKFQLGTSRLNTSSCFAPSLYFTSWTCSEKCITKLFINGQMNSSEDSPLAWTSSGEGYATAALPESRLSQCRWLDPSLSVVVTQEIVADNQTLLFIVYVMDHATSGDLPSAQLLSYWKFSHSDKAAVAQLSLGPGQPAVTPQSYNNAYMSSNTNHGGQASYMYTPAPPRYTLSTSMTC